VLPTLPAASRTKIEALCVKATNGDAAEAHAAAREVCEELVKLSPVPAGPLRRRVLAKCANVGKK
jgi:hypothetical protein